MAATTKAQNAQRSSANWVAGVQPVAQKGRAGEAEEGEQRQQQTQTGEKIGNAFHVDHRNAHRAIVSPVGLPEKLPA